MKAKAALIISILIALGLGVGLIVVNQRAVEAKKDADKSINYYSNEVVVYSTSLQEAKTVNLELETNLAATKQEYSNKLSAAESALATTSASLSKLQTDSKAAAEAAAAEIAERDKKIASLENQNAELDKEAQELRSSITNLESQITAIKQKLGTAEGERDFLQGQLKRLMDEKAELERKFNDLNTLRAQVRKVKRELAEARRLDWLQRGILDASSMKGGQRMMTRPEDKAAATNSVLNVELSQDGKVKVDSGAATNAPEAK